jgi:XTP/dITP diphosphohydrolase
MKPIVILLSTSNAHKREEILDIWGKERARVGVGAMAWMELMGLDGVGRVMAEPEEDRDTFEGNAVLKARHYADASGVVCLADDSGIEVDALGGEPGVRSARYAGIRGDRGEVDRANNALLLERLRDVGEGKRGARFVCVMALCRPRDGGGRGGSGAGEGDVLAVVRGTVEGRIIAAGEYPRGGNGFGYDPLFFVSRLGRTTAELSAEEKNAISHRGEAARRMFAKMVGMRGFLAGRSGL